MIASKAYKGGDQVERERDRHRARKKEDIEFIVSLTNISSELNVNPYTHGPVCHLQGGCRRVVQAVLVRKFLTHSLLPHNIPDLLHTDESRLAAMIGVIPLASDSRRIGSP